MLLLADKSTLLVANVEIENTFDINSIKKLINNNAQSILISCIPLTGTSTIYCIKITINVIGIVNTKQIKIFANNTDEKYLLADLFYFYCNKSTCH